MISPESFTNLHDRQETGLNRRGLPAKHPRPVMPEAE
jgi:hypothetical protein